MKLRKTASYVLCAALVCMFSAASFAATPKLISYQGKLTNGSGAPLSGTYSMQFAIYDDGGGSSLWSETQSVDVSNGLYNVYLGTVTPFGSLAFDKPYYLEIRVGSETLSPRRPLTLSPYAYRSDYTDHFSGNISTMNCNGGTNANNTTYWRGDGTWAAIPGGGGDMFKATDGFAIGQSTRALAVSTGSLATDIYNLRVSTGALQISTGTLQADIYGLKVSTGALQAENYNLKVSTGALQLEIYNLKVSTGALQVSTGTLQADIYSLKVSTGNLQKDVTNLVHSTTTISIGGYVDLPTLDTTYDADVDSVPVRGLGFASVDFNGVKQIIFTVYAYKSTSANPSGNDVYWELYDETFPRTICTITDNNASGTHYVETTATTNIPSGVATVRVRTRANSTIQSAVYFGASIRLIR